MFLAKCLNPRFDGAFLNFEHWIERIQKLRLNPRFDGAFLNFKNHLQLQFITRLNPRFDGAFLNSTTLGSSPALAVLIPDLMGLF